MAVTWDCSTADLSAVKSVGVTVEAMVETTAVRLAAWWAEKMDCK